MLNKLENLLSILKLVILKIRTITSLSPKSLDIQVWRRFQCIAYNSLTFDKFSRWKDKVDTVSRLV